MSELASIGLKLRSVALATRLEAWAAPSFETRSFGALLRMRAGRGVR